MPFRPRADKNLRSIKLKVNIYFYNPTPTKKHKCKPVIIMLHDRDTFEINTEEISDDQPYSVLSLFSSLPFQTRATNKSIFFNTNGSFFEIKNKKLN